MPAAIKKLPQTNVFGNSINTTLSNVKKPSSITPVLFRFHLPNISSISFLPDSIAHPCLMPIYAANNISTALIIFSIIFLVYCKIIVSELIFMRKHFFYMISIKQETSSWYLLASQAFHILSCSITTVCKNGLPGYPPAISY